MDKKHIFVTWLMIFILIFQSSIFAKNNPEMKNTAPVANFTIEKTRSVKILVMSDYTGAASANLQNSITSMKSELTNDAKIDVEYVVPTEIFIGSQNGSYIRNKWGMLGYADYTWTGTESTPLGSNNYVNKPEHSSFVYSTEISLPEGETPTVNYECPTSYKFDTLIDPNTYSSRTYRRYNFSNSNGILAGYLDLWEDYNMYDGSGNAWAGRRDFNTEPTFTYNNFWSVIQSTDEPITNNVLGWDLSNIDYDALSGGDTYVVFAMNNESTNYYSPYVSSTYRLGQLRSDANLGKYVRDSDARVYSICSESFENVNLSTNAKYPVTLTPTAQNISLKDLINMSYDGRCIGANNVSDLVKNIKENIKKPTGNIDMIIATDKSTAESNNFINSIKTNVSDDVSIQTSVVNKTDTLYNWDKPTFRPNLKVMGISTQRYTEGFVSTFIILTPEGELWGTGGNCINGGGGLGLLGVDTTTKEYTGFIKISDNVKDACIVQTMSRFNTLFVIKNDGTVWRSPVYQGSSVQPLNKIQNLNNIKKIQIGQVEIYNTDEYYTMIVALDSNGYLWQQGIKYYDIYDFTAQKMNFDGNGSIVDFDLPKYSEAYSPMFPITFANNNNEIWKYMHSDGYTYSVYQGAYNNTPLSNSLWQDAIHADLNSSPVPISPSLRITDLIKINDNYRERYFGIDANKQIYLFGGINSSIYDNTTKIINTDLASITQSTTIPVKAFSKNTILNTPLRENSDRYFVYISDAIGLDTSTSDYFPFSNLDSEIVNYLISNNFNIYVVSPSQAYDLKLNYPNVPTTLQTHTLRNLITSSNVDSAFCSNTVEIQKIIEKKYSTYANQETTTLTLILNEDGINYNLVYRDFENDPKYNERWQYNHEQTFFDNSSGLESYSGQWLTTPVTSFSKVGRYTARSQFRDNPKNVTSFDNYRLWSNTSAPATIIVHRRPIALFSQIVSKVGSNLNLSYLVQSYDLDHSVTRPDKGIVNWKWRYKNINSSIWIDGNPTSLIFNSGVYEIQLQVRDIEGAWSRPYSTILDSSELPPVVDCTPTSRNWANTDVTATVTASDPSGDFSYTLYKWSTSPIAPSSGWLQNNSATFTTTQTAEGIWYLHMEAHDAAGNKFYRYRGPYMIDKTPPVINTVTTDGSPTDANSYNVYANNVTDALSGVNIVRFPTWTSNNGQDDLLSPWTSYYAGIYLGSNNWRYTVNSSVEDGEYNTHVYAYDNAGNYSVKATPIVTLNKIKASNFFITLMLDVGWRSFYFDVNNGIDDNHDGEIDRYPRRSNTDIGTLKMPINYYELVDHDRTYIKAGYKVKGKIDIIGDPDWAEFHISYIKEGSTYTDQVFLTRSAGNTYTFEWIIPLETDSKTFVSFDLFAKKANITYGNEKWIGSWDARNTSRLVFYVKGKATDDLVYVQSH